METKKKGKGGRRSGKNPSSVVIYHYPASIGSLLKARSGRREGRRDGRTAASNGFHSSLPGTSQPYAGSITFVLDRGEGSDRVLSTPSLNQSK